VVQFGPRNPVSSEKPGFFPSNCTTTRGSPVLSRFGRPRQDAALAGKTGPIAEAAARRRASQSGVSCYRKVDPPALCCLTCSCLLLSVIRRNRVIFPIAAIFMLDFRGLFSFAKAAGPSNECCLSPQPQGDLVLTMTPRPRSSAWFKYARIWVPCDSATDWATWPSRYSRGSFPQPLDL